MSIFTKNGKHVTAAITLTETYLVMKKTIRNIPVQISTANGCIAFFGSFFLCFRYGELFFKYDLCF